MNGLNDKEPKERTRSTTGRGAAPVHVLEAVSIVRSFLERMRKEPKDPNETIEWIK